MKPAYRQIFHLLALLLLLGSLFGMPAPAHAAALIQVTTLTDTYNNDTLCSLREAIIAANENRVVSGCRAGGSGMDTIKLPAGTYFLKINGPKEDKTRTGDLDILSSMNIQGAGVGKTILDAASLNDRVFHVLSAGEVQFTSLEIRFGSASIADDGEGRGGGIFNKFSIITVYNVRLDGNKAYNTGGGIDNSEGSILNVSSSSIVNGSAKHGGGIFNDGTMVITESAIYSNTGSLSGGGLDNSATGGSGMLNNVTIGENTSLPEGGAGEAAGGAGIFSDGPLYIYSSTITKNHGNGLQVTSTGSIRNTIIAKQVSGQNCGFNAAGATDFRSEGFNLEDTNTCNFIKSTDKNNKGAAGVKLADTLANNGGPTKTYALQAGSPAIDGGSNLRCPYSDQRWSIRPTDGNGDGVKVCDIGAFEYGPYTKRKLFLVYMSR